jgi:hypothetical protein
MYSKTVHSAPSTIISYIKTSFQLRVKQNRILFGRTFVIIGSFYKRYINNTLKYSLSHVTLSCMWITYVQHRLAKQSILQVTSLIFNLILENIHFCLTVKLCLLHHFHSQYEMHVNAKYIQ